MFWYFFVTSLFGFICGYLFKLYEIKGRLTTEERIYYDSFYQALIEKRYKCKSLNEDKEKNNEE